MGASFTLTGEQILSALEARLQHLLDCEEWLMDLYRHPDKPLSAEYKEAATFDQGRIASVLKWCQEREASLELTDMKKLRPAEALLAEIDRLKKAADHVRSLSYTIRYQLPDEDLKKLYAAGKRSLSQRLDALTEFDDSE